MKKILVPTDFSPCAGYATDAAIELAKHAGGEVYFIHIVETVVNWESLEFLTPKNAVLPDPQRHDLFPEVREAVGKAKQALADLQQRCTKEGITAHHELIYNTGYKGILGYANEMGVDFIIMGSHGSDGMKELFVGSHTQRVVRQSTCPVLVVKKPLAIDSLNHVVFASDFTNPKMDQNLKKVITLAQFTGAKVHLLYVNTPSRFEDSDSSMDRMEKVAAGFADTDFEFHIINHFTPEEGIWSFATHDKMDMIAISIHGFTGFRRMVNNNITETLVNHSDTPVLSLNRE